MNRVIKIILIVTMMLGIVFSITNFISMELKASSNRGAWEYVNGDWECTGDGNECDIEGVIDDD